MNVIFCFLFILSAAFLFHEPTALLSALLDGATDGAALCVALLASYAVWSGVTQLWEDSGLTRGVSKLLKPLSKRLFLVDDEETLGAIGLNLSANLLGVGGVATPYGIKAANLLDKSNRPEYASAMLFVLNASSLQLLPVSVVTLRLATGSASPADIILPTLLTTAFSTLLSVALVKLFVRPDGEKSRAKKPRLKLKTQGAGSR